MKIRNGYFQVIYDDSGTKIKFYPPLNGGEVLSIDEVKKFLDYNGLTSYNVKELFDGINSAVEIEIPISLDRSYAIRERMVVKTVKDDMFAIGRFTPPSNDGQVMMSEEIINDLKNAGIIYGIQKSAIDEFVNNREYCKNILIAKGNPVVEGKDAYITYHFNTDRKLKPKLNEDGSVDFHKLDNIGHITAGGVLATLTREVKGKSGTNVRGQEIKPRNVTSLVLKYGNNITLSEDALTITSDVNGHANLEGDKVFVSNTYQVPADVDNSTGDIKYEGNIEIKGNVRTGFKIVATGDVEVYGIVEGAEIRSGGNIVLHRGIQGMGKGKLKSKGNIIAKFIESAHVSSGGYVESDSILHSEVSSKSSISARGSKGLMVGGHIRSGSLIEATTIGSQMGTSTFIEVGMEPAIQDKIRQLQKSLTLKMEEHSKCQQIIDVLTKKNTSLSADKKIILKQTFESIKIIQEDLLSKQEEYAEVMEKIADNANAKIVVNKEIYPGVKLSVSGEAKYINRKEYRCQYAKKQGQLISKPI